MIYESFPLWNATSKSSFQFLVSRDGGFGTKIRVHPKENKVPLVFQLGPKTKHIKK